MFKMNRSRFAVTTLLIVLLTAFAATVFAAPPESAKPTGGAAPPEKSSLIGRRIDGYRGIWFELGQKSEHGDKYSGGLGTYTVKHRPLAIYAPQVNKTFFVYGGTTAAGDRHLLAMIGCYDHARGTVPRPVVVHDKLTVNDPHDNPSLSIDPRGHLWVFVSGRGQRRPGFIYRSVKPYDIAAFELVREDEMTYPQPWWIAGRGCLLMFTRYTNGRELYWMTSETGRDWSQPRKLVNGGHYQITAASGERLITAYNTHFPANNVDTRTNLSFLQTDDMGRTWRTITGKVVQPPLEPVNADALVRDYRGEGRLVYLKDITFDAAGHPVILYITSPDHRPGPPPARAEPRRWTIARWTGSAWVYHEVGTATHNYDVGSLYIERDGTWRLIGPFAPGAGPQHWGAGGEVIMLASTDQGATWHKQRELTTQSTRNHTYIRRPEQAHDDFYAFWADGDTDKLSISRLYFTSKAGDQVWRLPYVMTGDEAKPDEFSTPAKLP